MSSKQVSDVAVTVEVQNIGGIDETSVTFSPGVTVLAGENATNRTSFLQAIMAALGSDDCSIKGDADSAHVELTLGGERYTRELTRDERAILTGGDPYLDDPTLADLFAFLLESNDARRAIATNGDLRELIMRPIDIEQLQRDIEQRLNRRDEIEQELEEIDQLKTRLPALEADRTRLKNEIEDVRADLADKEAELESQDASVEQTREEKAELEDRLGELRSKRAELEEIRYELDTERESIDAIQTQLREATHGLEDLPETPVGEIDELNAQIDQLREQKRSIESDVTELQSVIQFNREMIGGTETELLDAVDSASDGNVTDELVADETISCWTCGSKTSRDQIETTISRLQDVSQERLGEVSDIEADLEEYTAQVQTLKEQQHRREQLQRQQSNCEADLQQSEERIERLTDRRETLTDEVEDLEIEIEALEDDSYQEILELHKEANQLEYELGRLEGDLDDVNVEVDRIEERLEAESKLQDRREEVTNEIEELRTKIDRIEQQTIEKFNEHMDSVLEKLGYGNLERIWLERVEREVREGRRRVTKSAFELHVIRQTESGVTYEDTIEHLSESEREVTGLVFALAGYLAHEVYEVVPFMLLDSLEAIDSERIAALVEYIDGLSEYLIVALLPEDAAALSDEYQRISEI